ncbi:cyclic nucleotide-gated cation channel beta-3-like [Amphibalanus amphitrite]|uniref:cyclic nucleotide-gated cation channel beta-3-like n=1 Tax=Amphibalanus amphitrite TaxID=1232801 RepID=UPI001C920F54|nr:cyclic nucleotide-gated cation channel beta-3-like [Amphibalanus amphitrite]
MVKIHTYWEFFGRLTAVAAFPNVTRVARTLFYMFFLIHINSCAYYMASLLQGFGSNTWVYNNVGNAYARCVFFATKTAMSVGRNPKPTNVAEYVFMAASWLLGVFVFAILLGQIHDIVAMASRSQTEFRERLDKVMLLLKNKGVPQETRQRVKLWLTYTHQEDTTPTEHNCLLSLPLKLRTDVAMQVHYSTLGKVRLFRGCDITFLRDAVLQLQPVVLLPGDFVFRQASTAKVV